MNYDDEITRNFEEKFQETLAAIRKMKPENFKSIQENLGILQELISDVVDKPNKTQGEIEFIADITQRLTPLIEKVGDMKIILHESLYRQSRAYYENVKKLAKEGNKEAEVIYNDLKADFEKFDVN